MAVIGWRLIETDGTAVEPFGTARQAREAAEERARERGHGLLWTTTIGGPIEAIPDDVGPWVLGCRIEPIHGMAGAGPSQP